MHLDLAFRTCLAPRPEDDGLTEPELAELKRNLLLLSRSSVENFYRDAHKERSLDRKPNPKAMQQLVTAWKVRRGGDGNEGVYQRGLETSIELRATGHYLTPDEPDLITSGHALR